MYSNKGDVLFSLNDGKSSDHQKVEKVPGPIQGKLFIIFISSK